MYLQQKFCISATGSYLALDYNEFPSLLATIDFLSTHELASPEWN